MWLVAIALDSKYEASPSRQKVQLEGTELGYLWN